MYCPRLVLSFITRKVVRKELLQEMGEFDWLRKHVLQIDNANAKNGSLKCQQKQKKFQCFVSYRPFYAILSSLKRCIAP